MFLTEIPAQDSMQDHAVAVPYREATPSTSENVVHHVSGRNRAVPPARHVQHPHEAIVPLNCWYRPWCRSSGAGEAPIDMG